MSDVSPVFREARARSLVTAARALDPSDPSVPRELVTLPGDSGDRDEAKDTLLGAAKDAVENPIEVGGQTPAQREAAEEYDDSEESRASLGGQATASGTGERSTTERQSGVEGDTNGDGKVSATERRQASTGEQAKGR
jgi:hypothetical protein